MTVTLNTHAARTAVNTRALTPAAARKVEELALASARVAGVHVDAFDAARSFPKADGLVGAERALFHAAYQEIARHVGVGLTALGQRGQAPEQAGPPSLFSKEELEAWRNTIGAHGEAALDAFRALRLARAAQHPGPVTDALLVLVGSRGTQVATVDDVFKDLGRGGAFDTPHGAPEPANVDVRAALPTHDTPENRRLVHAILAGFLEMPTTVAGSAAVRYFLGTGSFAGKDKVGVGLLSSGNAWAKAADWKNADTERVIEPLFAHHYRSNEFNGIGGLLTQPKGGFTGYPAPELWDAAYAAERHTTPFAMTHSERNKDFIGQLMTHLEARGLGPALEVTRPKLSVKLRPSDAKKALLQHAEAQWDAAIVAHNQVSASKIEGKAKDQQAHVWERATVTRNGVKEQVQRAGGDYGSFQAIIVTTPEGSVTEVHALDRAKLRARDITMADLKDPSRPWLDRV